MTQRKQFWMLLWRSESRLDGKVEFPIWEHGYPLFFRTRQAAREWCQRYSYISRRPDLRGEPHGWKVPRVVRAMVTIQW